MAHRRRPLEAPSNPAALAAPELRALSRLWTAERRRLDELGGLARFQERLARRWSIETGIIERLYDVSEGVTLQLVEHGLEASLIPHGESNLPPQELVSILRDHRQALQVVVDLVAGRRPLTVGWMHELHQLLTRHQDTCEAVDALGRMHRVPLRKGAFKLLPNNPRTPEGTVHEYCPPEQTASEVERMVAIHAALPEDLPEVRAAWLHHAFTATHPYQDGNGRMARALASLDFIRCHLFPATVLGSERDRYIACLRAADAGDLASLVQYFAEVQTRAVRAALSEADAVTAPLHGRSEVLAAAEQRIRRRADRSVDARREIAARMAALIDGARATLESTRDEIRGRFREIEVRPVQLSANDEERRWFRSQLIAVAERHGYWADLTEHREWARLQLRDGGVTDIVVALHFVGRASPGAGVAVAFVIHRDAGGPVGESTPPSGAIDPLTLFAEEEREEQARRFQRWLDEALVQALAEWTRYL